MRDGDVHGIWLATVHGPGDRVNARGLLRPRYEPSATMSRASRCQQSPVQCCVRCVRMLTRRHAPPLHPNISVTLSSTPSTRRGDGSCRRRHSEHQRKAAPGLDRVGPSLTLEDRLTVTMATCDRHGSCSHVACNSMACIHCLMKTYNHLILRYIMRHLKFLA